MNLARKHIGWALACTLLAILFIPTLWPSLRLFFFSPFFIITFYRKNLLQCLWLALACGTIMDLLGSESVMGLYALTFCLTTALLYEQKRHFFADSLSTLPIMTFFFSALATVIYAICSYIFERNLVISPRWVATDLVIMPLLDALYGYSVFILPSYLFGKRQRKGHEYFSR